MARNAYRVKRHNCAKKPHLRAVVNWNDSAGKRCRQYFNSMEEAKTFAEGREIEARNQGLESLDFPTWLRVMAQTCHVRLAKEGKTLSDATEHFLAHLATEKASVSIEKGLADFYASKERRGVCRDYLVQVRSRSNKLATAFPQKLVSSFTLADCERWLSTLNYAPHTSNIAMLFLREFFAWAKKRNYFKGDNPTTQIELLKEVETPVGILTPEELARALLEDMQARAQDPVGGMAIRHSLGAALVTPAMFNSIRQNPRELQTKLDRAGRDAYVLISTET